jgi:hypothetical protein
LQHFDDCAIQIILGGGYSAALAGGDGSDGFWRHFVFSSYNCAELLMKTDK